MSQFHTKIMMLEIRDEHLESLSKLLFVSFKKCLSNKLIPISNLKTNFEISDNILHFHEWGNVIIPSYLRWYIKFV